MTTQTTDWDSAINRINRLLDETDSLKADLEQALELLTKAEWPSGWCQGCGYYYKDGHATDCLWANLLSKYNREVRFHDLKEAE